MATTDILTAFMSTLSSFDAFPIAWPGIPMTPPSEGIWLEARFFPNEHRDLGWDNDSQYKIRGTLQVLVFYRPGIGENQISQVDASTVADDVIAHFPKGTEIGAARVLKLGWQSPAIDLKGKSYVPVSIPYVGITQAP